MSGVATTHAASEFFSCDHDSLVVKIWRPPKDSAEFCWPHFPSAKIRDEARNAVREESGEQLFFVECRTVRSAAGHAILPVTASLDRTQNLLKRGGRFHSNTQ
ncbi:hypothetical protein TNCV_420701 [Trichonephila clavipes]|nr:hypothetical protein TNCV_420701 [Trichonephila clavipes]